MFRAPLDLDPPQLDTFAATLSPEELSRAGSLQSAQARARRIADHGWRRRLLARTLGDHEPAELTFTTSEHGKPSLRGAVPLHFSASRSDDIAWYAVSLQAEVGVDIERVDHARPRERLARRLLSARERALYDALPDDEQADALYACWTCKEAAVKALGSGLVFPLTVLEAWTGDGSTARTHGLQVCSIEAEPGRAAAVAVRVEPDDEVVIGPVVDLSAP